MAAQGLRPLADEEGLALFDAAAAAGDPLLVPAALDPAALRPARAGALPPLLPRGLLRAARTAAAAPAGRASLAGRLAAMPPQEQHEAVCRGHPGQVAAVLGHASAQAIDLHAPSGSSASTPSPPSSSATA